MNIARYSIEHRSVIYLLIFLLSFGGLVAYDYLGKLEDPEFAIKTAVIVTPYVGASPYEVEQQVTDIIERAAQSSDEVENIYSISRAGVSVVYVDILERNRAKQIQQLWDMLRRKITAVQGSLPEGAGPSKVMDDFGDVYGIFLALTGDGFSNSELNDYAEFIQRELLLVKDISRIEVCGTKTQSINIDISENRIAASGIHPNQIINVLQNQNLIVVPGSLQSNHYRFRMDYPGDFQTLEEIAGLVIGNKGTEKITLSDIAVITRDYIEPTEPTMRFNGKPALGIAISASSRANVVTMGDAVEVRINELLQELPVGVCIDSIYYQSNFVKDAIKKFVINLMESVGIVIIVLLITMGLRSGLLIASNLIFSILGTLIIMLLWGIDLHRISIASLILVMGMIVDNAIVVTDGSLVRLKRGQARDYAAIRPAERTMWPLLGATIIACLAFLPIFLSPNNSGEYCRSLFQVVSISLILSWLLSVTQTPIFSLKFLKPPESDKTEVPFSATPFRVYRSILEWCMQRRLACVLMMIGMCIYGVIGMEKLPKMFFADSDKAQFLVEYWLPEGTRIEQTSVGLSEVENYLKTLPEVINFTTIVGEGAPRYISSLTPQDNNPAFGIIVVNVNNYHTIPALQDKLDIWFAEHQPDADPKMRTHVAGPAPDYRIEARFSGPDPAILRELTEKTKAIFQADPETKYVRDDWRQRVPVWKPTYSQQRGRDACVERRDVAWAVLRATDGIPVTTYREGNDLIPVKVRSRDKNGHQIPLTVSTSVWGAGPESVPLGQVANVADLAWEDPIIRRYDRRRAITAQCDTTGVSDAVLARVRPEVEALDLPAGYTLDWAGEYELSTKGNEGVQKFMPLAMMLMVFILVTLFNGFRQPLIIMLVIPLSLVGMVLGLLVTNLSFGFLALLGAYSLVGMLIKNAVVLIEEIEFLIKSGKNNYSAVMDASVSRLRPVAMTSATTIFGMSPLLSDDMFNSMAVTIMFGLAFATVLTLIAVPVLYTLFYRISPKPLSDQL